MNYPDFEFLYYRLNRFYRGELDDYDRNTDPVPKTIMDIPMEIMQKITSNLGPMDLTNLRSMNKSFKNMVDSRVLHFHKIEITVLDTYLDWQLDNKSFECYKNGEGCKLYTPNKRIKSGRNYIEKGLEYLTPLFKVPKLQVNHFTLNLLEETQELDSLLPVPFHAKSVKLHAFHMDQMFPFLSALNPGGLESIHLHPVQLPNIQDVLRFLETDLFKQAKHVKLNTLVGQEFLIKFRHLKSFKFEFHFLETLDIRRLRDIISTFKQLESCKMKHVDSQDTFRLRKIGEALGEEIPFGPLKTVTCRYRIPESNDFLEFKIEEEESHCYIEIVRIR